MKITDTHLADNEGRITYYRDDNNLCCIVGTVYALDYTDLAEYAEMNGYELVEIEAPDEIPYDGECY